jgi:hypothetical protein
MVTYTAKSYNILGSQGSHGNCMIEMNNELLRLKKKTSFKIGLKHSCKNS